MDQAVCCYRHPDRETGVRCARCERPICPDCMVSASVGFQCPECVSGAPVASTAGRRTVPAAPRPVAVGRWTANPRLVTVALILVNAVVYLVQQSDATVTGRFELFPPAVADGEWYRLFTAMFLHENPTHIILNMLSLWWIGPSVEVALGRARYLALYLVSGLGGSALSFLLSPADVAGLGASGAIFGLLGALFVLVRRVGGDLRPIAILIALNLAFSFAISDIDWRAHVGGLVTGTVIALGMVHAPRERRALVQWGTCAVTFVVVLVVIAVGAMQYTG